MCNPFLQALAAAEKDRQTHYARQAAQTQAHFAQHPECAHKILSMDMAGHVNRGESLIDVDARCRPHWFTQAMWKQRIDSGRPLEARRAESQGYWYRIDDLSAESQDTMPAGTREAASLWKAALVMAEKERVIEAARKAEVQRKKLEMAQLKREVRQQRVQQQTPRRSVQTHAPIQAAYMSGI